MRSYSNARSHFMKLIDAHSVKYAKDVKKYATFVPADEACMACVNSDDVITKCVHVYATVELHGTYTRAQMVVDWGEHLGMQDNVKIVTALDQALYEDIMERSLKTNNF